ncbi:MAG: sulfotransferase domain-containing protein [Thermoanaerobaculia bacterium]
MKPTVLFLSVHKAASTFLARDFAPAIVREMSCLRHVRLGTSLIEGRSFAELALPPTGVIVTRLYPHHINRIQEKPVPAGGRFADKRILLMRRDPRDVAVSWYYSLAYSHDQTVADPRSFTASREAVRQLSVAEGIAKVTGPRALGEFRKTNQFLKEYPQTCVLSYEKLVTDFSAWLEDVQSFLGWSSEDASRIGHGLEAQLRPPREEDPSQHKRRVLPGNWQEVFNDELVQLFAREAGSELVDAGYEW